MSSHPPLPNGLRPQFLQMVLIVVTGFWVYSPALHGDWLWDDNLLITDNPLMNYAGGLGKIWFQPGVLMDYYPITFSAQRLEWKLWGGLDPTGYHCVNLGLHLASALLVWRLLSKLGLRLAWWGGLLFAVHPVMVESVVWISELKNTLSLVPFLLALGLWIDYEEQRRGRDYWLALVLFLIAMLGKSSTTMLPVVILLYAWWKKGSLAWHDLKTSAPFFVLSLLVVALGMWLQHYHPVLPTMLTATPLSRMATVGWEILFFFSLCVFPVGLLPIYPDGLVTIPSAVDFLPWLLLVGLFYGSWINRATWGRHVLLGAGFFVLNLVPALQYILNNATTMNWSMDHLVYLPSIGLIGLAVAGLGQLEMTLPPPVRSCVVVVAVIITALLSLECHSYATLFGDSEKLWTYALQRNPGSWMIRQNLGDALLERRRFPEAVDQYSAVIKSNPYYDAAHLGLGNAFDHEGRDSDAIREYAKATKANPALFRAYAELGNVLLRTHRFPEAIDQFEKALQLDPVDARTRSNLGVALSRLGRISEAGEQFETVLQLDPDNAEARSNLGVALARTGRMTEAGEQFETVLQLDPNDAEAHNNLGSIFLLAGRFPEAIDQYQAAVRLKPDFVEARKNLTRAQALEQAHRTTTPSP
jgi:protein O-mannosyl-transferase